MDSPFKHIKAQWLTKVKAAREQKKEFQRDGEECMRFFRGPYDFLYGLKEGMPQSGDFIFVGEAASMPRPSVAMTLNKVAEAVQIFGPVLYHTNPVRKVSPRKLPPIPITGLGDPNNPKLQQMFQQMQMEMQMQNGRDEARASIMQWYQDYTPLATDLKTSSREAIDECLIKGMGILWPQLWTPPASQMRIVASVYDSVDHLFIDCDMESRKDAKWICRACTKPVWEFEQMYGVPRGTIKGSSESYSTKQSVEQEGGFGEMARRQGKTNDLITYYEIYSKMGMGPLMSNTGFEWDEESKAVDQFGQFCYLVVCKELEYPANIPPQIWDNPQAIHAAVQWPVPYYLDDVWPFAELVFHDVPNQTWPMNHFKPAMGELKFLNWAYSFLASRMKKSARDILVGTKGMGEDMKRAILSGEDMEFVQLENSHGKTIAEIVQIIKFPEVNGDMFKVIEMVTHLFEQRTGLTELMYGQTQATYRSAEEAKVKQQQLNVRPDDMRNKVEDFMGQAARMEALAARYLLEPMRDLSPVAGQVYAQLWEQFITPADPVEILHQIEYRIEAGSTAKPNRDKDIADTGDAMKTLSQPLLTVAMQHGEVRPYNALVSKYAETRGWDATPFLIPPPPPPPPPPPDQPKFAVSLDFATLTPELQHAMMRMAGLVPVEAPPPAPPGAPPPPKDFPSGPLAKEPPKPQPKAAA